MLKLKQAISFVKRRRLLLAACASSFLIFHFFPLPESLHNKPIATLLLAEDKSLLAAKIAEDQQWRFPYAETLPKKYETAVIEFEDKYFYQHPGVNPFSLLRAAQGNFKAGRVIRGGSTLSMQLARLLRSDPPRTYINKAIEILLAFKLEWHYSKKEILALYASNAPFGGNTVGLSAACWRYLGRTLEEAENEVQLTWAEAALLAVLPNSPALIHPGRGREALLQKRNRLLEKLFAAGKLDQQEYTLSLLEPLPEKPHPLPQLAPHLLHTLIEKYPHKTILHSTLQASTQNKLAELTQRSSAKLQAQGVHNLAVLVIDNRKLSTIAYVGNATSGEYSQLYSPDVDIVMRPRSTGSILKPFLYAQMLQHGMLLPDTLVPDIPGNYNGFTPENYDREYRGAVRAKHALAQSLNIPAVRMLKDYGIPRFYDDLKRLGMTTLFRPADDYGLSLILGGAEGTLWEISSINARMMQSARQGWQQESMHDVTLLKDELPSHQNTFEIQQGTAWLTLQALIDVARPGNDILWREFSGSQKIAWKTGTSYGLRDAWAIGSNGSYTVGVWAGNASGEGVAGLSGLKTAAPVLFETFNFLGSATWLPRPEHALKKVEICKGDGYLANNNCETKTTYAPLHSHFQKNSPHYKNVKLDQQLAWRVHGGCEEPGKMANQAWLVLPPLQEYYWKQHHKEYRNLPPWREDCITELANYTDDVPMEIVYPHEGSKIYIPLELSGKKGRVVFKASHRNTRSKLFWHIDNQFIQETQLFHDISVDLNGGWHQLVLVDESGFRLERWFKILEKEQS